MNDTQKNLIYLLSCAVNSVTPDKERVQAMELEQLYGLAKFHSVRAAVCLAIERADIQNEHFHQAYKKAVRKNIFLDMERSAIEKDLDEHGIWYMPLKGSILKDLYPENGMREMADNDVLFDATRQEQTKEIMLAHGYKVEHYGAGNHDVYMKPPVLNFELHTSLFGEIHAEPLYRYYADTKHLLIKNEDSKFGYHFSDEDFYVFMTAHEWKHYNGGGTGIRSLLDCYVYCKNKADTLDWNYITEQCKQLEIGDFEQERRLLAMKVFSTANLPELTESEQDLLMFYLTAGTYGTFENRIKKQLSNQSKLKFWMKKIFWSRKEMAQYMPFTKKCILLYPVGWIWHILRAVTVRRGRLMKTIKAVNKYGK